MTDVAVPTDDHSEASVENLLCLPYLKSYLSRPIVSELERHQLTGSKSQMGGGRRKFIKELPELEEQTPVF